MALGRSAEARGRRCCDRQLSLRWEAPIPAPGMAAARRAHGPSPSEMADFVRHVQAAGIALLRQLKRLVDAAVRAGRIAHHR